MTFGLPLHAKNRLFKFLFGKTIPVAACPVVAFLDRTTKVYLFPLTQCTYPHINNIFRFAVEVPRDADGCSFTVWLVASFTKVH